MSCNALHYISTSNAWLAPPTCCLHCLGIVWHVCAVQAVYDAKSEEIGPGIYRFKAEIGQSLQCRLAYPQALFQQVRCKLPS